jgi:hypothetical protein
MNRIVIEIALDILILIVAIAFILTYHFSK